MLTDEQLAAIAARVEAATLPRWIFDDGIGVRLADYTPVCFSWSERAGVLNAQANMQFIAAAREDVPALLEEANTLRRQLAEAQRANWQLEQDGQAAREEAADLRRQLEVAQEARHAANARAAQAEARRQYESIDSYNQRINDALRSFSTNE